MSDFYSTNPLDPKGEVTIDTGLRSRLAFEIIDSFFGQLSDGWGENNPRNDRYWKNCRAMFQDGKVLIKFNIAFPYYDYGEDYIFTWIANGIKKTAKFVEHDCGSKYKWSRANTSEVAKTVGYFGYGMEITVKDIYFVYDYLKGRNIYKYYSDEDIKRIKDGVDAAASKPAEEAEAPAPAKDEGAKALQEDGVDIQDLVNRCAKATSEEEKKALLAQIYQEVLKTKGQP